MQRAAGLLASTVGEELPTVSVTSADPEEAIFLGQNISKLSPIMGNLIERRIPLLLENVETEHGMTWRRQDPDFPDAALFDRDGKPVGPGFEVKAWYPLATEITGRFRESQNLLNGKDIRLVVVAWMMSHIVYGTPEIVGVLITDALSVAKARDSHYHDPPGYLCEETQDTTARTRNLQQTNVLGYKLQELNPGRLKAAKDLYGTHTHRGADPHSPEGQELVSQLRAAATYRLDSNFAKIDRIDHKEIEAFKAKVLGTEFRGRTIKSWAGLLKMLNTDAKPAQQKLAAETIATLYAKDVI